MRILINIASCLLSLLGIPLYFVFLKLAKIMGMNFITARDVFFIFLASMAITSLLAAYFWFKTRMWVIIRERRRHDTICGDKIHDYSKCETGCLTLKPPKYCDIRCPASVIGCQVINNGKECKEFYKRITCM